MFGGCQKKMYYIKDTKSKFFSEAYFVLKNSADEGYFPESDLAAEADRILREKFSGKRRRRWSAKRLSAAMFAAGLVIGASIVLVIV
ncbi:MAG: hypothetical protein E7578_07230 [Ruminococcaceae bacterium]|nr:hypothetical protein [Oscillospiraceae bacterium]